MWKTNRKEFIHERPLEWDPGVWVDSKDTGWTSSGEDGSFSTGCNKEFLDFLYLMKRHTPVV